MPVPTPCGHPDASFIGSLGLLDWFRCRCCGADVAVTVAERDDSQRTCNRCGGWHRADRGPICSACDEELEELSGLSAVGYVDLDHAR